jgi:O-glycosyl hydrolase
MKPASIIMVWAASVAILGAVSTSAQPVDVSASNTLTLRINTSRVHQKMAGFGASDAWRLQIIGKHWPEEKKNKVADLLFSSKISKDGKPEGIGLSLWRFYIGSGSMEQGTNSGIADEWRRAECFQNPDGTYDWSKHAGQRWFLQAAKARGVSNFLAFSIAAPAHLAANGRAHGFTNTLNIQPGKLDDYAKFLVDVVEHFEKREGIPFQYLSPINEPQWNWAGGNNQEGTAASNAECHEFVRLLGHELQRRKLRTQVVFGEASFITFLYSPTDVPERADQIRAFLDRKSPLHLGDIPNVANIISGHSYGTTWPVETLVSNRLTLRRTLDEVSPKTAYWQTEFCILENTDEIGSGRKRDLGMDTALYVARVIHADLTLANAASWQWWTAVTRFDYKDGLIYVDDGQSAGLEKADPEYAKHDGEIREAKLLWALGNYSLFIRPGMVREEADFAELKQTPVEQARDLMVSAFRDPRTKQQVVVFVNCSQTDRRVAIPAAQRASLAVYVTSATRNLERQPAEHGGVAVPARSVVTVVF